MPRIYTITRATHLLFARHALSGVAWRDTSRSRPDGRLDLMLADDVVEQLELCRLPGETDDDLLLRILSGPAN